VAIIAKDILDLANSLYLAGDEVSLRSAASRAYYAAYHACLPIADNLPSKSVRGGSHERVIAILAAAPSKSIRKAAAQLKMAKDTRVIADYDLDSSFRNLDAISTIRKAESISKLIE